MNKSILSHIRLLIFPLLYLIVQTVQAQLGFCGGNSGDPIFTETFGTGITNGPPLPAGTTSYNYVAGQPNDGSYTISSRTNYFDWFDTTDHTPGDTNGKAFIVNASFTAGLFFRRSIDGLCENTSYEFSSWLLNLHPSTAQGCNGPGIPVNVRFQIWDNTDTNLLASGDTGDIFDTANPLWRQYGLVFQTLPGQTSVILKMINNGAGGCGNDLAIDDIVFRSCGDNISMTDSVNNTSLEICEDELPISTSLTANPDFSVYSSHAYQWQVSNDNSTWIDIIGATGQTYNTPLLNNTTFYRVKVAEDAINLANDKCNTVSDIFKIIIIPKPSSPLSAGDVLLCENELGGVLVSVTSGVTVDWYDAPIGGNLLLANNPYYETPLNGTYYAQARSQIGNCTSDNRTAVSIFYNDLPVETNEDLVFCEGTSLMLATQDVYTEYLWNTGASTSTINIESPGDYSVLVTNINGCSTTKNFTVKQIDIPKIVKVNSNHRDLTIITENIGNFEYSLNGSVYQDSPLFTNRIGDTYIAYVREKNGCGVVEYPFVHLVIPRFITPNGDGINDRFKPEGIDLNEYFELRIFNRTSNLLFQTTDRDFSWDGQFNNTPLPASDYWYAIQLGAQTFYGHFAIKR